MVGNNNNNINNYCLSQLVKAAKAAETAKTSPRSRTPAAMTPAPAKSWTIHRAIEWSAEDPSCSITRNSSANQT